MNRRRLESDTLNPDTGSDAKISLQIAVGKNVEALIRRSELFCEGVKRDLCPAGRLHRLANMRSDWLGSQLLLASYSKIADAWLVVLRPTMRKDLPYLTQGEFDVCREVMLDPTHFHVHGPYVDYEFWAERLGLPSPAEADVLDCSVNPRHFVRKAFEEETCANMCERFKAMMLSCLGDVHGTGNLDCSQSQTTGHAQAMPASVTREMEEEQEEGSDMVEESLVDEEEFLEQEFEMAPEPVEEVAQDA
eukprot:6486593-Amphidinium_carterae.1